MAQNNLDESNELLESLIGVHAPSSSFQQSSIHETYQLPIRVGVAGKSLDEGDRPWVVGNFSPHKATDANHPHGHEGVDLKASKNTPIFPIASGKVIDIGINEKGGNYVKTSHENGKVIVYYAHMEKTNVQKNELVNQSSVLGYVGSSGNAIDRGAHLHFTVKINGSLIDPFSIIGKTVGSLSKKSSIEYICKLASLYVLLCLKKHIR